MFMQRVLKTAKDPDSPNISQQQKNRPVSVTNGVAELLLITMQPGTAERWRTGYLPLPFFRL
jgi:hypothetical protein